MRFCQKRKSAPSSTLSVLRGLRPALAMLAGLLRPEGKPRNARDAARARQRAAPVLAGRKVQIQKLIISDSRQPVQAIHRKFGAVGQRNGQVAAVGKREHAG
nr:hypothetical protein [Tanacetum cinerariifolium]